MRFVYVAGKPSSPAAESEQVKPASAPVPHASGIAVALPGAKYCALPATYRVSTGWPAAFVSVPRSARVAFDTDVRAGIVTEYSNVAYSPCTMAPAALFGSLTSAELGEISVETRVFATAASGRWISAASYVSASPNPTSPAAGVRFVSSWPPPSRWGTTVVGSAEDPGCGMS